MSSNSDSTDVEGWEVTNGQHQSSPDSDISSELGERTVGSLKCAKCTGGKFKYLKNLGCQCDVCSTCAQEILKELNEAPDHDDAGAEEESNGKIRKCAVCKIDHPINGGLVQSLKPVFGPDALRCMQCRARKDTEDAWWCQDCSSVVCSKCAHKSHRDHATVEFDQDYDTIRFCCSMLQTETRDTATRFKTMTWAKFEEIFKLLESCIDQELDSQNKQRRSKLIEIFGPKSAGPYQTSDSTNGIYKRLSAMQQKAQQQFTAVLDEILNLTGLRVKFENEDPMALKTDIVSEKVLRELKKAVDKFTLDDFRLMPERQESAEEEEAEAEKPTTTFTIEPEERAVINKEKGNRHY